MKINWSPWQQSRRFYRLREYVDVSHVISCPATFTTFANAFDVQIQIRRSIAGEGFRRRESSEEGMRATG